MLLLVNVVDYTVLPIGLGHDYSGRVVTWMQRSFINLFFQSSTTYRPLSTSSIRRPALTSMLSPGLGSLILTASTWATSPLRPRTDPHTSSHYCARTSIFGRSWTAPPHLLSKRTSSACPILPPFRQ
ncbi:hypothetical protein HOY80DRAFT_1065090 [Tuber brumale]|nr:hypothetical protein HOY80DRAFT_1065090 [Tuber brumale]